MSASRSLKLCSIAALVLVAAAGAAADARAAPNLIRNGDFSRSHTYGGDNGIPLFQEPDDWATSGLTIEGRIAGGSYFESGALVVDNDWYGTYTGGPDRAVVMFHRARMEQSFTVTAAGGYRVSWDDATAALDHEPFMLGEGYPEEDALPYRVMLGSRHLGDFGPAKGQDYTRHGATLLLQPGTYTLSFTGLMSAEYELYGGYNQYARSLKGYYTLLDNVTVAAVPEPASYALLASGLALLIAGRQLHRRRQGPGEA
ncbi:PEP-CTERM sorting domain-containing protein [Caldimonas brevitalea]|uniref:Uncharacterized protein n=1 Tax=Caldimonas brevitalea TaxID=413882 RepID=A0A0G3BQD8_9BURK|nr:PEP-CTERM sorting domain-containing protein [Caldimonas brevitalea]AKJ30198.1 hypothetical protein AAW51_3507 [Caldimonas brevitalea]